MQLADGRQVARWSDPATGAQRQESLDRLGLTSQARRVEWAIAKAREVKAARLAWSLSGSTVAPMSVDEAIAAYKAAKPVAKNTEISRKPVFEEFVEYCTGRNVRRIDALTGPRLWPWRDQVVGDKSRLESTRNLRLQVVGAFLRWAADREMVPLLPYAKIRSLCRRIDEPRKPVEFLRPPEIRKVLAAALKVDAAGGRRRKTAPFIMLLLLSGVRFDEAAGLDWREVDLEAAEIRLPPERCKGRRGRTVTLAETPTLADLLLALHKAAGEPKEGLVFGPRWLPYAWRQNQARVTSEAGVEFTPHTLRRSCGTIGTNSNVYGSGASAWCSAKRLGHSVTVAERRYAGALPGLPPEARTIEAAAGCEDQCRRIVDAVANPKDDQ